MVKAVGAVVNSAVVAPDPTDTLVETDLPVESYTATCAVPDDTPVIVNVVPATPAVATPGLLLLTM